MRSESGRADWIHMLEDLDELQRKWTLKTANLGASPRGLRAHGVAFGIETGRRRIAEEQAGSLAELNALLGKWESIANLKANNRSAESIKGIDFGIHLVINRVRQYLRQRVRPKPPTSAKSRTLRSGEKRRSGF